MLLGVGFGGAALIGLSIALSSSVVVVNITRSRRRTTNAATEAALLELERHAGHVGGGDRADSPCVAWAWPTARHLSPPPSSWLSSRWLPFPPGRCLVSSPACTASTICSCSCPSGSGLALAGVGARFFGVPLALAAFVAGLAVGESPAAAEARRRILPFRDLFAVLFFVSLGSLIDPRAMPGALPWLAFLVVAVVIAKVLVVFVLSRVARMPEVRPWQLAIGLGQIGEFSFVLASIALGRALLPAELYNAVLVAVVLTIAVSTTLARLGHRPTQAPRSPAV